jgi:hypothetical protein
MTNLQGECSTSYRRAEEEEKEEEEELKRGWSTCSE